jgi:hypothetical protein
MCCPNLNDTLRMDCAAQFRTLRLPAQETWMAIAVNGLMLNWCEASIGI